MFLFLKKLVLKINQQSKDYFVDKLQVYDELINEKEKIIKGLDNKIEEKQREFEKDIELGNNKQDVYLYDDKNIEYQDTDIFKKMKDIESRFSFNSSDLVKDFVSNYFTEEDISYFQKLMDIRDKMNQDFVYKVVSKGPLEQKEIVLELFGDNKDIVNDFCKRNKSFNILKFISYFDKIIDKYDPFIYIYVGSKNENYDTIHPFIRTRVDEKIYKGISIIYRGKLYDYSLK
jgi:hypothetical protein